jgi:hypothetical protein
MGKLVLGSVPPRQEMGATPRIYAQLWPGMGKSSDNIQFRHIKGAARKRVGNFGNFYISTETIGEEVNFGSHISYLYKLTYTGSHTIQYTAN